MQSWVEHIKTMTEKISKTMKLLHRFQSILPRSSLLAIYKTFIRSQLDYADVILLMSSYNSSSHEKLESLQYNTITGIIRRASSDKLYHELGLEYLKPRFWFRKWRNVYKRSNEKSQSHLLYLTPNLKRVHETRHSNNFHAIHVRQDHFKNSFFPSIIYGWNNHDWKIRISGNFSI